MIKLTELQVKLAEQLLLSVKKNERVITYKELAGRVNPPIHYRCQCQDMLKFIQDAQKGIYPDYKK